MYSSFRFYNTSRKLSTSPNKWKIEEKVGLHTILRGIQILSNGNTSHLHIKEKKLLLGKLRADKPVEADSIFELWEGAISQSGAGIFILSLNGRD